MIWDVLKNKNCVINFVLTDFHIKYSLSQCLEPLNFSQYCCMKSFLCVEMVKIAPAICLDILEPNVNL